MTLLSNKTKVLLMFIITIGTMIVLGLIGTFDAGTTTNWEGWVGGTIKSGAPGESVYFNYSVEVEGGRYVLNVEIEDFQCEWNSHVSPGTLTVKPGETRILSVRIDIPEDAEVGDSIVMHFYLRTFYSLHGFTSGSGRVTETLHLTVIEEEATNENDDDGGWSTGGRGSMEGPDIVLFVIGLYLILFAQAVIFYLIPALWEAKKHGKQEGNKS